MLPIYIVYIFVTYVDNPLYIYSSFSIYTLEAEYAYHLKKIIIPCKMEPDYDATGWLGFLIGTSNRLFDFSGKYHFEKKMEELLREINIHLNRKSPEALAKKIQKSLKTDKHDVMVSYSWGNQKTVLKIRDQLRGAGLSCWINVEQMSGSILEVMARTVENCSVFLLCYSQKYKDSQSLRTGKCGGS